MPPASFNDLPKYRLHKASGLGVVTLDRKDHYLGVHGTAQSVEAYHRLISEWLANGRQLLPSDQDVTVVELVVAFMRHAEGYYRKPDGTPTSETDNYRQALRPLHKLYGTTPARLFGPKALRALQQEMIRLDWCRRNINTQVNRIRSMFKWAVSHELIPSSVYEGLRCVAPLKAGRTTARESGRVKPVPIEHVNAVQPYVSRQVWALIQLQLRTGARAGELVIMRPVDLDTSDDAVWVYRPTTHKTEHHGHERVIVLGPQARQVLEPFLSSRPVDAYLFSPAEAENERRAVLHARRETPLSCGNRPGTNRKSEPTRTPRARYDVDSYRRAIARGCERADVPCWHPHQLRHNAATVIRKLFDLETSRAVLGHHSVNMTALYAERDAETLRAVMSRIG